MERNENAETTTNSQPTVTEIPGQTIRIRDWDVYYIKVGHGPKVLFASPGSFGTVYGDFPYLVNAIDEDMFTAIFWELPGYGRSRPRKRDFKSNSGNYYVTDAEMAHEFLEALGIKKYSFLGHCAGGIVGLIHAAKYPENVEKLVIWGGKSYITQEELDVYNHLSDVKNWSPRMIETKINVYGLELFKKMLSEFTVALNNNFKPDGNICSEYLKDIKCPVFILHGGNDRLLSSCHFDYLCKNISNVKGLVYPDGKHNFHLQYAEDLHKTLQEFLLEP